MQVWSVAPDFIVFTTLVVAAFVAAHLVVVRWAQAPVFPRHAWMLMTPLLALSWWHGEAEGNRERSKIVSLVSASVPTYARELGRQGHAELASDAPADHPLRRRLVAITAEWMQDNPAAHDIYTLRREADGRRVFIVDGDTDYDGDGVVEDRERGAPPGQAYDVNDPGLDRALRGEALFDFVPVTDSWGTWVSAWAPIFDPQGRVDGVIGVDFDAGQWLAAIARARRNALLLDSLVVFIVLAALVAISVPRRDLALRRAIEADLRRANTLWSLMVERIPLPFIQLGADGRITSWNPAAEKMFGYTAAEMIGRPGIEMLAAPDGNVPVQALWTRITGELAEAHSIHENVTKDGRRITCEWFNAPVLDRDGRLVGVVSLAQDLTERLSLQRQVQESQKLNSVGVLAAGVAHDFNNMLTIIQGHTDLILMEEGLSPTVREDAQHVAQVAERAAHLTRQLLAFARQRAMFPQPLELNEVMRKTAGLLEPVLGDDIRLECDLTTEPSTVEADATLLEQVITNLAVNARDAMPRGGTLTIRTRRVDITASAAAGNPDAVAGEALRITVADTGKGIPESQLSRIFEPFFTTKEVGRGTGLGLSAVHGIVKQHGGWVEVQSHVGVGTRFEIYLPASTKQTPAPTPEPPAAEESMPRCGTVLLVEDDPQVRRLAREALARGGFEVLEASDGPNAEAVWTREHERIDLLCTDMVMPNGLNGRELAGLLLESKPDLGIIYCSGYSVEVAAPGFCATERQVFLQKPYTPNGLVAAARGCLPPRG